MASSHDTILPDMIATYRHTLQGQINVLRWCATQNAQISADLSRYEALYNVFFMAIDEVEGSAPHWWFNNDVDQVIGIFQETAFDYLEQEGVANFIETLEVWKMFKNQQEHYAQPGEARNVKSASGSRSEHDERNADAHKRKTKIKELQDELKRRRVVEDTSGSKMYKLKNGKFVLEAADADLWHVINKLADHVSILQSQKKFGK